MSVTYITIPTKIFEVDSVETDEALALHQTLLNSRPPAKTTVDGIRDWFLGINNGQTHPEAQLWGSSATLFDDPSDLVALRVPLDQDRLSDFILNYFGRFLPVSSLLSTLEGGTSHAMKQY